MSTGRPTLAGAQVREQDTVPQRPRRRRPSGQVLILFVMAIFVLLGFTAIVIDISWYWSNTLQVQRAADAAALAGAVKLPGDPATAVNLALAEARKNGYSVGAANCPVTPGSLEICAMQDTGNRHQMNVTITTQVPTFFAQIVGIGTFEATLSAKAQFALPIPMGSPLNYYGVGCLDTNALFGLDEPDCTQAGNSNGPSGVPDAQVPSILTGKTAPNQLDSQGAWGVVFTRGGDSRNGDAFSPTRVSTTPAATSFVSNRNQVAGGTDPVGGYDPAGYSYGIDIPPSGGGSVYIFDAGFCGMPKLGSGRAGTGDEWTTAGPGASNPGGVTTYYNLWHVNDPFSPQNDTLLWSSGNLFVNMNQVDESGQHGTGGPQYPSAAAGVTRCDRPSDSGYDYHLKWWQIPTSALAGGQYRLQVTTTNVDLTQGGLFPLGSQPSDAVGAANRWGLEVTSAGGQPRVHGLSRMATYANIQAGTESYYLAQIDAPTGANKTVEIQLYDPGDVGGGAWLEILSPDNNTYAPAAFTYTSASKSSGAAGEKDLTGTASCIETNYPDTAPPGGIPAGCPAILDNSGSHFDNYWLTIRIPLPATYGSTGLAENGWWKIRYTVGGGNDTTTWMVDVIGNPVHLVVP